jgi:hypothetical protein
MPQIDFFLCQEDERWLVDQCVCLGLQFIPDLNYGSRDYEVLASSDEVLAARGATRLFHLSMPGVSQPPEMRQIDSGQKAGQWFILQRNGGPLIQLFFPTFSRTEVGDQIAAGFLGYHKTYWDLQVQENRATPTSLIGAYRHLAKKIRAKAMHISGKARTYFLFPSVEARVKQGLKLLGVE